MTATATMPRPAAATAAHAARTASSHAQRGGASGNAGNTSFAQLLRAQDDDATAATATNPQAAAATPGTDTDAATARPTVHERERKPAADDASAAAPAQPAVPADATPVAPAVANTLALATRGPGDGQDSTATPAEGDAAASDPLAALRDAMGHGLAQRPHSAGAGHKAGAAGTNDTAASADAADTGPRAKGTAFGQALAEAATDTAAASAAAPVQPDAAAPAAEGALPSLGAITDPARGPHNATPAEAPAPAQASLAASPGTPAFAPALGAQLSTWLKDGVQHASLELNPQDLGPIDVRIAVKDGQTQVNLAADVASTRQALADALPLLSAALDNVGLSLSGGGVADPSAQRQQQGDAAQAQAGRGSGRTSTRLAGVGGGAEAAGRAPATARQHRGLLDLYA